MKLTFEFEVDENKFNEFLESRARKLKDIYVTPSLSESFSRAWNSSDLLPTKLELNDLAYVLFADSISESLNDELMRDKNCWE